MIVPHRLCQIPLHMAFYRYNTSVFISTSSVVGGGKRMKRLWQKVAQWVYAYGVQGAGAPSYRGAYEAPVPKALRK